MTPRGHGGREISGYLVYLHDHKLRADSSLSFTSPRPDLGMVACRTPTRGAFCFVLISRPFRVTLLIWRES